VKEKAKCGIAKVVQACRALSSEKEKLMKSKEKPETVKAISSKVAIKPKLKKPRE
jgi:hypothetical protein